MTGKEEWENSLDNEIILYLDLNDGYMVVYIYQNSSNNTLQFCFSVYEFDCKIKRKKWYFA